MPEYKFSPFQKVLVRDNNLAVWECSFYSHCQEGKHYCTNGCFRKCIPYNDDTKKLVGTRELYQ